MGPESDIWKLSGYGYVLVLKKRIREHIALPEPFERYDRFSNPMFFLLNYTDTNIGPYWEGFFSPGRVVHQGKAYWTVSHIVVNSEDSQRYGRQFWGLPKLLGDFTETHAPDNQSNTIDLKMNHKVIAHLNAKEKSFCFPFSTKWLPLPMNRFVQEMDENLFFYSPELKVNIRPITVESFYTESSTFPHLQSSDVLCGFKLEGVTDIAHAKVMPAHS